MRDLYRTLSTSLPPPLTPPLKGEGDSGAGASVSPSPLRGGVRGGGAVPQPLIVRAW